MARLLAAEGVHPVGPAPALLVVVQTAHGGGCPRILVPLVTWNVRRDLRCVLVFCYPPLSTLQSHGRPTLKALLQQWNKQLQKQEAALSASQLLQSAHFQTLFGNIEQRPDPWEALTPASKAPPVEVIAPGDYSFQPEGETTLVPQAAGAGAPGGVGGPTTAMWSAAFMYPQAQGVQGLAQPLDLNLLEGAGKRGPAPQKAATVGVPVHFAAFQPKPKPLALPAPEPAGGAAPPAANGQGPHAVVPPPQKPKAAQAPTVPAPAAGRAGGLVGPTMADFEWAAMEAAYPPR